MANSNLIRNKGDNNKRERCTTWRGVLALQRRRCELHTAWASAFKKLLLRELSHSEFESVVRMGVLSAMSETSNEMMSVRDDSTLPQALRQWAAAVQLQERTLFQSTLQQQQLLLRHLGQGEPSEVEREAPAVEEPAAVPIHSAACALRDGVFGNVPSLQRSLLGPCSASPMDEDDEEEQGVMEEDEREVQRLAALRAAKESCKEFSTCWKDVQQILQTTRSALRDLMDEAEEEAIDS